MAYTPYYSGGWQSGEEGGTPITPAALNNMETGIQSANASGDKILPIISCDTGLVESGQNVYISTGSAKRCILFIQRNPNGGAMYGVDVDVLTPYITVSGVAVDLPNSNEVRILNQSTGRTLTWFVIRLGAAS
jgi:hypothetical protein